MRDAQLGDVDQAVAEAFAKHKHLSVKDAHKQLSQAIEYMANLRRNNAHANGYEPPIWFVASALLRDCPITDGMRERVRAQCGLGWDAFQMAMCKACGFERPVDEILILGANRSGKTDWASKLMVNEALRADDRCLIIGAQTRETSKRTQQDRVWHYLPTDTKAKNGTRDNIFYLNYKIQTGFTFNKFTLENRSNVAFTSYEQNVDAIMEGPAFHKGWFDEEFPKAWLDALRFRLASTRGQLIGTFTPVSGYTPVVADFLEGMVVTRWTTAYLLPKDGLPALPGAQLGLSDQEYDQLCKFYNNNSPICAAPDSRPEDCFKWLETEPFSEPENVAPGRVFEKMPRVARKRDGSAAILWFLGRDNPYGSPGRVIEKAMGNLKAEETIRRRVYGMATKTKRSRFPTFNRSIHIVPDKAIPSVMARTMVCDPAPERNWFFLWMGVDAKGDVYVYREWPGSYAISGVGVPGPWAEISSKRNGINDGDRGPAQEKFGFSLERYKAEWARLEAWDDAAEWVAQDCCRYPSSSEIAEWSAVNGTREPLRRRVIDARASSQSKITMGEDKSLFDFCLELSDDFVQASGSRIGAGEELINSLLNPAPGGRKLFVAESCRNTIFALQNMTGADGQKGACKEPIDCLRYGLESGMLDDVPDETDDASGETPATRTFTQERTIELDYTDD